MSITWPSAPSRQLGGSSSPLVFSASYPLAFLNVSYTDELGAQTGEEEPAYRDGAFIGRFAALSEKVGNEYRVRRDGGWPANPAPHAEEVAQGPTGGQAMGAIYEVDLRAQPNLNLAGASGTYTIDGLDWYAKGPLGRFAQLRVVNGQGLEMQANNNMFWGDPTWESRIMLLPLTEVPGYNPLAPLIVRGAFDLSAVGLNANHWTFVGIMDAILDGAQTTSHERGWSSFAWTRPGSSSIGIRKGDTTGGNEWFSGSPAMASTTQKLIGLIWSDNKQADVAVNPSWTGSGALPDTTQSRTQTEVPSTYLGPASGFVNTPSIAIMFQDTTFAHPSVFLTHLSITQPKVAA
jgi:hypothetical protein